MDTMAPEWAACVTARQDAPAFGVRRVRDARDGTPILLRAIEPDDLDIERELVDRLSSRSRYLRLMSARKPTEDELIRWTRIDRRREGAVIATIRAGGRERLIGVARYAIDDGSTEIVECAIVIDDAWQRQGLGRMLLSSLIDLARRSGMRQMVGTMLRGGRYMAARQPREDGARARRRVVRARARVSVLDYAAVSAGTAGSGDLTGLDETDDQPAAG
ncbi:hypothetical protein WS64_07395 [Burkholderia anthina]|uniref:N-acetyltransferase domain-containing protein n=1 Tax=Burkholderia anthina TaxID=179879 RepID=A0AAW3Q1U6_9BURK|nr:hypothetical protein WS64_07395 [Burkholderia anthina]